MSKISILGWVAILATALFTLACAPTLVPVGAPRGGMVTQASDTAAVRAALSRALLARRFTIESESDGTIVARLDHRGISIRIDISYDATSYRIGYLDSAGLSYAIDPQSGEPVISHNYNRYLARLDRTIVQELGRPAAQAAEAAEEAAQREREALEREQAVQIAQTRAQTRAERRAARRERRAARRADWMEIERERQATERERLRAEAARAEADAEYQRRQPLPTIQEYSGQPVVVERFQFEQDDVSGSISLTSGFLPDPYAVSGRITGRTSSARLGLPDACPGFWSRQPQQYVQLPQGVGYLRVEVSAAADTTLAIVTPDGQVWCDDDSAGGTNPRLHGQFPAGTYAVYVGTYNRNTRTRYSLSFSELRPPRAVVQQQPRAQTQRVAVRQAQPAAPPSCRTELLRAGHNASGLIHCRGAEPYCAAALLRAGHNPSGLIHCNNVEPQCAVELIRSGQNPSGLIHCQP